MRGPRTKTIRRKKEELIILSSDVDPYKYDTMDDYLHNLTLRLEIKQQGLSKIIPNVECHREIHPKYLHQTINEIKHAIQPYINDPIIWSCDEESGVCSYCGEYTLSSACEGCGSRTVIYDIDKTNEIYPNPGISINKQVNDFLSSLSGHVNYSHDDWIRIKTGLDNHFHRSSIDLNQNLVKGILPCTTANMMKDAMDTIKESSTDACVYYACLHYWKWEVFDFMRYVDIYVMYIGRIDLWCSSNGVKMNKMFKYYWISLVIGFAISRYYFRIRTNEVFSTMKSLARTISREIKIPIPRAWVE